MYPCVLNALRRQRFGRRRHGDVLLFCFWVLNALRRQRFGRYPREQDERATDLGAQRLTASEVWSGAIDLFFVRLLGVLNALRRQRFGRTPVP